jgi:hypothetical protein
MFGKRVSEYLSFQKGVLLLMAVVGILRLGLSLAHANGIAFYFSITVVALAGLVYYGVAVHLRRFGSYKQLLPLVLFQTVLADVIAVIAIVLTMAGLPNIYSAPEFNPPFVTDPVHQQWLHAVAHMTIGVVLPTAIGWIMASLVLLVTKAVVRR